MIEIGGQRLETTLPGRQGRQLFAYLVLNRHRLASRDELVEALWPNQPTAGETGLNPLISKLRKSLGASVVDGRSSLRLRLHSRRTTSSSRTTRSRSRSTTGLATS